MLYKTTQQVHDAFYKLLADWKPTHFWHDYRNEDVRGFMKLDVIDHTVPGWFFVTVEWTVPKGTIMSIDEGWDFFSTREEFSFEWHFFVDSEGTVYNVRGKWMAKLGKPY